MNTDDIIRRPSFMKKLDKYCPKCRTQSIYLVHSKEKCGECDLRRVKALADERRKEHYEKLGDPLADHYKEKANEKKEKKDNWQ